MRTRASNFYGCSPNIQGLLGNRIEFGHPFYLLKSSSLETGIKSLLPSLKRGTSPFTTEAKLPRWCFDSEAQTQITGEILLIGYIYIYYIDILSGSTMDVFGRLGGLDDVLFH